jgi:hypothetical protein
MEIEIDLNDFDYSQPIQKREIIDWNCLDYSFDYRSHILNKFPSGWQSIPGFDEIIDKMVEQSRKNTPLEQMEKLIEEAKGLKYEFEEHKENELFSQYIQNGNDTDILKLKNR